MNAGIYLEAMKLKDIILCECGNKTWLVNNNHLECTSCSAKKGLPVRDMQTSLIKDMGIPPTLPNAIELARAHLDRLQRTKKILDQIQKLIESE
jgi:hypothetical protein